MTAFEHSFDASLHTLYENDEPLLGASVCSPSFAVVTILAPLR